MPERDIIVVGASAGGVETLTTLVRGLPPDLPAAVFVVLHFPAHTTSLLPAILSRAGALPARHAEDGEEIVNGRIYIAPPDRHLLVERGVVRVTSGPRENGHRPAVDPLFRSAARAYARRVVGVVLSGTLDDGTAGLQAIKTCDGVAVVQDPADALFSGMPLSAIENVAVDQVLPAAAIAPYLARLARDTTPQDGPAPTRGTDLTGDVRLEEMDMAAPDMVVPDSDDKVGDPSPFGCPECGGVLRELREGELVRYRCRVGHAYGADSLLAAQSDGVEDALWSALRALEESESLARRLAARPRTQPTPGRGALRWTGAGCAAPRGRHQTGAGTGPLGHGYRRRWRDTFLVRHRVASAMGLPPCPGRQRPWRMPWSLTARFRTP